MTGLVDSWATSLKRNDHVDFDGIPIATLAGSVVLSVRAMSQRTEKQETILLVDDEPSERDFM